jgi:hypothetical protein
MLRSAARNAALDASAGLLRRALVMEEDYLVADRSRELRSETISQELK